MSRTILRPGFAALTVVRRPAPRRDAARSGRRRRLSLLGLLPAEWRQRAFASKGPDQTKPADGSVEGWRHAVGEEGSTRTPRVKVTFDDVCGDTNAKSGEKRVRAWSSTTAGWPTPRMARSHLHRSASAPRCPTAATGAEVLADVADVRSEQALVCAIDEFPATGCGGEVKKVSAAAKAPDEPVKLETDQAEHPPPPRSPTMTGPGRAPGPASGSPYSP